MKKHKARQTKPSNSDEYCRIPLDYGTPVRVLPPRHHHHHHNHHQQQQLHRWCRGVTLLSPSLWLRSVPFPFRRLFARIIRFLFLVILMVTVIINILFIIDTRNRLQQQTSTSGDVKDRVAVPLSSGNDLNTGNSADRQTIQVEVVSSQTRVMITIDGTIILDDAEEAKNRGIHILVLNQMTGSIMARRHFDTYSSHEDEQMSLFVSMVSEERVLIFAIKDEGTFQLKKAARDLLARLGSRRAQDLGWRDMWAMVVHKRLQQRANSNTLLGESLSKSTDFNSWASPAILKVEIELLPESDADCQWSSQTTPSTLLGRVFANLIPKDQIIKPSEVGDQPLQSSSIFLPDDAESEARRRHFCSRIEGYGSVCSCSDPLPLRFVHNFDPLAAISQVPIAIIASNRPNYLYRMLRTLLATAGCNPAMVTVFIDGYYEEPLEVAKLFGLRGIQHTPIGQKNARISQHYKASLTATFNLYPDAQYAIVLEEDLDVSPDFFHYFAQTMHLLDEDPSLFCVSTWNDLAYEHTSTDTSLLYRVENMPGLGWMLTRKLYKEELESKWPTPDKSWDWDMWMRLSDVRRGRECVVPDVSRTYHFGSSGLNMNPYFQDTYFKKHAFNTDPSARLKNVNLMKRENYERLITRLIRLAVVLDQRHRPCESNFLKMAPEPRHNRSQLVFSQIDASQLYVLYIRMTHERDTTWLQVAKCLRVWDLDARGSHRGLWRLHYQGVHLLVVGVPHSPYSVFKPQTLVPFTITGRTAIDHGSTHRQMD